MEDKTIILPSARAIRHRQLQLQENTLFLPNYLTMSDFISKLTFVKDFTLVDNDTRILLLLEASNFKQFSALQIERNFFTFTKNSSYIFKFFEELSAELFDIAKLDISDLYAEYEEHITILQELYKRYEKLCYDKKILDKIFLPKLYQFNKEYASTHNNIEIHIDGHLTNFEFELLFECSKYAKVNIVFDTSFFNIKMQKKFNEIGIELEKNYHYLISLNSKEIIKQEIIIKNRDVHCESFSESLLQIAFIKQKIFEYINLGFNPNKIAIIVPDEKIAPIIKSFDEKSNFNFAMGESFVETEIYKRLEATYKFLEQYSQENSARLENRGADLVYKELFPIYKKIANEVDFISFLNDYMQHFTNKRELKIFEEEIYSFKTILPIMSEMSVKSLLSVFLQRLSTRTIDDVRGGKITVMGLLETRSVDFDAIIIVDFNDTNVPKKSDKDMFLNTKIREIAKLPTMIDRENLQRHYYEMLINRTDAVSISYVKSSESSPSKFLKQLGIYEKNIYLEQDYADILFEKKEFEARDDEDIILEYSFKNQNLSATKLKTFLSCKRKFYHKYVQKIKSHEIPRDMPQEWAVGIDIHTALKELYTKKRTYNDIEQLQRDLEKELNKASGESELEKYLMSMQKKRMDKFCKNDIKRFSKGWEVAFCEQNFSVEFAGITLIGQIDRIDKKVNEIEVLDYKTGSYPLYTSKNVQDATDFQLEFYYLLASGLGNVVGCGYYDLKESKIVPEVLLQEKLSILESNIKDLLNIEEINFKKSEDLKNCLFCEFSTICNR